MIRRFGTALACVVACTPCLALASIWTDKKVESLQANHVTLDCYFFKLEGVTQADPAVPGNPWFAVLRSELGSKDAYAMLLAARVSGVPVTVYTDGTSVCGYARAYYVMMD